VILYNKRTLEQTVADLTLKNADAGTSTNM